MTRILTLVLAVGILAGAAAFAAVDSESVSFVAQGFAART